MSQALSKSHLQCPFCRLQAKTFNIQEINRHFSGVIVRTTTAWVKFSVCIGNLSIMVVLAQKSEFVFQGHFSFGAYHTITDSEAPNQLFSQTPLENGDSNHNWAFLFQWCMGWHFLTALCLNPFPSLGKDTELFPWQSYGLFVSCMSLALLFSDTQPHGWGACSM